MPGLPNCISYLPKSVRTFLDLSVEAGRAVQVAPAAISRWDTSKVRHAEAVVSEDTDYLLKLAQKSRVMSYNGINMVAS